MKQKVDYVGYKDHPYDALLDLYEEGMSTKKLDTLFAELKPFLTNLAQKLSKQPLWIANPEFVIWHECLVFDFKVAKFVFPRLFSFNVRFDHLICNVSCCTDEISHTP